MREIVFRAWDIENKHYIYDMTLGTKHEKEMKVCSFPGYEFEQYTNLDIADYEPDCDMRIFEGDKLAFTVFDYNGHDKQYEGVVKFADGQWQIWKTIDSEYYGADGAFDLCWVVYQDDEIEITGNIHEEV